MEACIPVERVQHGLVVFLCSLMIEDQTDDRGGERPEEENERRAMSYST